MADLTPEIADEVLAACTQGASEVAEALGRAFAAAVAVKVGQLGVLQPGDCPTSLTGAGLIVVLPINQAAALVTLPASSGLLPPWCAAPDPTGQGKLMTLAQELGMNVLPETFSSVDARAVWAEDLSAAVTLGKVAGEARIIPLELASGGKPVGVMNLIWPVSEPGAIFNPSPAEPVAASAPAAEEPSVPKPRPKLPAHAGPSLPPYTQSLLRIRVPVVVTLAEKRQVLSKVLEISPGTIIQFEKSCEEMLDLSVANRSIAAGEAVKVGDKFGLRITSMTPPDERFHSLTPTRPRKESP